MTSRRILIVDDEPLIAALLEDWLLELGYQVAGPACSVADALAILAGGGIDGAILDVTLGRETSYPVAEELRRLAVPFVFATGHSADHLEPEFQDAVTLAKPFDFADVQRALALFPSRDFPSVT